MHAIFNNSAHENDGRLKLHFAIIRSVFSTFLLIMGVLKESKTCTQHHVNIEYVQYN
jgi:hypothetical protein